MGRDQRRNLIGKDTVPGQAGHAELTELPGVLGASGGRAGSLQHSERTTPER